MGYDIRLPTEWEWQQAATCGEPNREYPWSGGWDPARANTYESGLARTTAVGMYPAGASPVGALDMGGNVLEWCLNEYARPENTRPSGHTIRVVRGGSWFSDQEFARAAYRPRFYPDYRYDYLGLRVVRSSPSSEPVDADRRMSGE